jgi:aspartate carbamoyltransferase regulatory subunit
MRILKIFIIFFTFLSLIVLLDFNVHSGECSKDDVIKMIDKGFSKEQIEKLCKETLFEKNPMCCCEIKVFDVETKFKLRNKYYEWTDSSGCLSTGRADNVNAKCRPPVNCGR